MRKILFALLLVCVTAVPATAQVTGIVTFTTGAVASADQVNANFALLAAQALNRAGGTATGNIAASAGVTFDGIDIGAALCPTCAATFGTVTATTFTGALAGNATTATNATTVTNGVYTTGSYSDPAWLTISKSKVGLSAVDNTPDANKSVLYATSAGNAAAALSIEWAYIATRPQIVGASSTTPTSTTDGNWTDTGLTVNITLRSAASAALVQASVALGAIYTGGHCQALARLVRTSTDLGTFGAASSNPDAYTPTNAVTLLDTPGSAGPHTYKVQMQAVNITGTCYAQAQVGNRLSTITVVEVIQ